MQKAVCIGGPLDGQYAPNVDGEDLFLGASATQLGVKYERQALKINDSVVLYFYLAEDTTITAALHKVFANYVKKGK